MVRIQFATIRSMNVDPDFVMPGCIIAGGAITIVCRNYAAALPGKFLFRKMASTTRRCVGALLLVAAIGLLFASTSVKDVPGPMDASKPEFTFDFSIPFMILSAVLAVAGTLTLVSSISSFLVGRDSVEP
jgi:hypothetical protein